MSVRDARLQAAVTRWLADHDVPDPAAGAAELVLMVRGHGWRPVDALAEPPPDPGAGQPAEEWRAARAAVDTRPPCTCGCPVLDHRLEAGRRTGCSRCGCGGYAPVPGGRP